MATGCFPLGNLCNHIVTKNGCGEVEVVVLPQLLAIAKYVCSRERMVTRHRTIKSVGKEQRQEVKTAVALENTLQNKSGHEIWIHKKRKM